MTRSFATLLAGVALCGASGAAWPKNAKPAAPAAAAAVDTGGWSGQSGSSKLPLMTADAIRASAADFSKCLESLWPEAQRRDVARDTFDTHAAKLKPDLQIMDLLDNQPEFAKPIWDYIGGIVTDDRIAEGRAQLEQHRDVFDAVEKAYGVDRYVLAAIWGVESNYGKELGDRPVIRATATLACVGRRQGYFREEFVSALEIIQHGDIAPERFVGNWSGAFGMTRFIPSSFKRFAVDFDGDGKRDLIGSIPDALASAANYLKQHGWSMGEPWGYEVTLPQGFDYQRVNGPPLTTGEWSKSGLTGAAGKPLPEAKDKAFLLLPAGAKGPAFLAFTNFASLLTYNDVAPYVLTVGLLSDRLRGGGALVKAWPTGERVLTSAERFELQDRLWRRGLLPAMMPSDRIDLLTQVGIQKFQISVGQTLDGFATADLLERLRAR